jgi:transposase
MAVHCAVSCGIDWAEDHHDVALVDVRGTVIAKLRIGDDPEGLGQLLTLLSAHGDEAANPIPVAIETPRGLLVACLRAGGRRVFAINPLAVARYRERHSVSRKKSDAVDAATLANILRTDMDAHRPLPVDSELAQAVAVLARAQQDAVWDRTQAHNKLRSALREFFPAFLHAFSTKRDGILRPDARVILAAAPTPTAAAALTTVQLQALLRQAGRKRGVEADAARLQAVFSTAYLRQPKLVEDAYGRQASALLRSLDAACANAAELEALAAERFEQHPDAKIIASFPGLGALTGARVLAEIGDDRSRFVDARALKAYAGSAPVTRESGKSRYVMTRKVKNQRLAAAGYVWSFSALTASPGARAHYDRRRMANERHVAAQRNLFNRMIGMLYNCLQTGQIYDEQKAFPRSVAAAEPLAA